MSMVEEALVTRLRAVAGVTAIASTRTYIMEAPQGTTLPFIAITAVSIPRELAHDGATTVTKGLFQVSCISSLPSTAKTLAKAVVAALHGFRGTVAGVTLFYAQVVNETDLADPDYGYQVAIDVEVSYQET